MGTDYKDFRRGVRRRLLSLVLLVVIWISLLPSAYAEDTYVAEKPVVTRDIAIAFDNSGSMYGDENTAWCRAIYAMEVFASMLNEGDSLSIYPMWEIEAGGGTYSSESPLRIVGGQSNPSPSAIRDIYTPFARTTPIETIDAAFQDLMNNADPSHEQWLIVLTDGDEFQYNGDTSTPAPDSELSERLTSFNGDTNVMYLGIGEGAIVPSVSGSHYNEVEKARNSADVLSMLTTMGNNIFGRDVLPNVGSTVSFDVSLSKLILFVQGDNITDVSLKDANGATCQPTSVFTPSYGTRGAGEYDGEYYWGTMKTADPTLSGTLVTYDNLDAGTYTLSHSGNVTNVSAYYEPDVRVALQLRDPDGMPVDPDKKNRPGTYYLDYALVDRDGNPTASSLLGNVDYEFVYNVSGTDYTISASSAGTEEISLAGGDTLNVEGDVTYLSGYRVHISNEDAGIPAGGIPIPKTDLHVEISGGQDSYQLSQLEEQAVYTVTLSDDDGPVIGDDLERAQVTLNSDGLDYECVRNGDAFDIILKYDGSDVKSFCRAYTINALASYERDGATLEGSSEQVSFEIEDDTFGLQVELKVQQGEYILSKMDDAKPILVSLSQDGLPLDDEALQAVNLDSTVTDGKGNPLDCTITYQPVLGQSRYELQLNKGSSVRPGTYTVTCRATGFDNIGQEISGEDTGKIHIRLIPIWIPMLAIVLLLALLGFLIWKFFDMLVLPKGIDITDASYTLDGDKKPGHITLNYDRLNAKQGTIEISTNNHPMYKGVNGSVSLVVVAASPRRVKSAKRNVTITEVAGRNTVSNVAFGATKVVAIRDDNDRPTGKFAKAHSKGDAPLAITIRNGGQCSMSIGGVASTGEEVSGPAKMKFVFK